MVSTTERLMNCGFRVTYWYTQSDEISLLFHRAESLFSRKLRKFNSVLAGEASAQFSLLLGGTTCFDCRISQLPTSELVVDYFRWRSEDAQRNALNGHCYWALRKDALNEKEATQRLLGMSVADKNELLFQFGVNFNDLPNWQKRGIGLYWEGYEKIGTNPLTGKQAVAVRRRIKKQLDLPMKGSYGGFIRERLTHDDDQTMEHGT